MLYAYHHHHSFRPVDWRFRRIVDVVRKGQPPHRAQDDDQMRVGFRFLCRRDAATSDAEKEKLFVDYPEVTYAYELRFRQDAQRLRFVIEARILAGQSDQAIAEMIGTFPETVYWYEALFYCVRDRLSFTDYIVEAIRQQTTGGNTASDDLTIKLLGYFGGPFVLEHALYGFSITDRPKEPAELAAFYDRTQRAAVRVKAVAATLGLEIDENHVMSLVETHRRLMEMESRASSTTDIPEALRAMDGLLSTFQWEVGRRFPGSRKPTPLDEYGATAAELRADEMVSLVYERDSAKRKQLERRLAQTKNASFDYFRAQRGSADPDAQ